MDPHKSQIETRARLDAELLEEAYTSLGTSVRSSRQGTRRSLDEVAQTDAAACACLDYLGVTPGAVPGDVSDLDERLEYLCRPSGTMRRTVKLNKGWEGRSFGVLLARLDSGEAVALIPALLRGYKMLDVATGVKHRVSRKVAEHIDSQATFFYRPLPSGSLGMRDLVRYMLLSFEAGDYLRVLLAAIVATLVGLLPTWANNLVFGTVIPSGSLKYVLPIACLLVGVVISRVLVESCRTLVMSRLTTKLSVLCGAATYARVLMLPPSFFKKYESGNLYMRVSQVSALTQNIASLLLGSGLTSLLSLVYLVQIWAYAPALAVPAFLTVLAQALLTLTVTFVNARYERVSTKASAKTSGTVTALLNGVSKIKLAGAEERAFAKWAKDYATYARASYNRPVVVKALPSVTTLVGALGTAVVYYVAGGAHVSVADYMSFNVAFGMMAAAVTSAASMASQMAMVGPMYDMVRPIFETAPEVDDGKPMAGELSGAIEVSGVTFRYDEGAPYVMQDLSFSVSPGEYVAIVGRSGCGKSTLVRLLLGFERPERGSVFYGNYDVGKVDLRSLRRSIGTVMQDSRLFSGDISSNITISMPMATQDDAWEAAEIAGIADDIRKMPMGMLTLISEGSGGISGGQRQRIMIARAVCGNRKIVILDEATSALDNVTQKQVTDALEQLGCTRVVVAHRLSTVQRCDRILVLDGGRIAEEGTYDELMSRNGIFAELVARQRLEDE